MPQKGITRRRLKGQPSTTITVSISPGEMWLLKDEAKDQGVGLSKLFQILIQEYFQEEYDTVMQEFAQRAAEGNGKSETVEDTKDLNCKQGNSSTPSGTELPEDTSTATV
jgi:hypothetical protein